MAPKRFWSLPKKSMIRALHGIAERAIASYPEDIRKARVRLYGWSTNALFTIDSPHERYIMRLATPGWRSQANIRSEALWLKALENESDIRAPRVIPTERGELTIAVRSEEYDLEWLATVMSWVPGRLLGHYLSPVNLRKMGRLFGRLHLQAAAWTPPAEFSSHVFDAYLSRGETNCLESAEGLERLASDDVELIGRTIHRVERAYRALDRSDIRVIHCDLWHDNIKLYKGDLYPFDFEDTILGFRIHDIAMAMLDLLDDTDEDRYPILLDAFRNGYEELLDWPDGELDVLQAGRILWILNYIARAENKYLPEVMNKRRSQLLCLERTGHISLS